ncbi:MAG TPA: hypothetical protein VD932_02520 [Aquabacterium sp.]|nr:hypothetical protein [Aquabacterium sp.]
MTARQWQPMVDDYREMWTEAARARAWWRARYEQQCRTSDRLTVVAVAGWAMAAMLLAAAIGGKMDATREMRQPDEAVRPARLGVAAGPLERPALPRLPGVP